MQTRENQAQASQSRVYNETITTRQMCLPCVSALPTVDSERRDMKVSEIKGQLEFFTDALFQSGYDMGWNSVVEELQQQSDREWNDGNKTTAEVIRKALKQIQGDWDDVE